MKRWLALALLVALPVAAQDRFPRCRSAQGRSDRGFSCDPSYAFFEFAPASGAGLRASCACAAITGAKGETVTWTRGSSAMCTKSASESSIANGDLVLCGSNLPRVMSLGGPLGVLVESSRQNTLLRSQELDNAAWLRETVGAAAAVVTADQAIAPDGTLTAERIQSAATAAGQASSVTQAACPTGFVTGSIYLKGNGTSGTTDLCINGADTCVPCAFNASTWSRCTVTMNNSISGTFFIGNETFRNGGTTRAANDFFAWQADCQLGSYATSPISTTTVAVTRSADLGTVPVAVTQQPISLAWTSGVALPASVTPDRIGVMTRALAGSGDFIASYFQSQYRVDAVGSASNSVTLAGTSAVGDRWAASHVGGVLTAYKNGVQTGTATLANTLTGATILGIGSSPAGASILDGVVSRICVDPDPNRCR